MTRIPHPSSDTEVRQAFQRLTFQTDVITTGTSGKILVGAGVGVAPVWTTELTALTLLTVDNITINGAVITSDTGAIGFSNENLTTTGTIAGINVTSGADPGHTHTTGVSGIDISDDTNLAVIAPIVLTDDTLSLNQAGIDHGTISGRGDDDHTIYLLASGARALTGNMAVDAGVTIDGRDISADWITLSAVTGMVQVDAGATAGYLGAAANDGVLRTSTGISYADGGNFVTLTTNDGEIVHDNLSGYDANDHIDHTGVTLTAGTCMTGGGDISAGRTFDVATAVVADGDTTHVPTCDNVYDFVIALGYITATLTQEEVEDYAGALIANGTGTHTGIAITYQGATNDMDFVVDHNTATNYVANEHINHTGVTLTAGSGLTGSGDISANRTFDLDINSLAAAAIAAGDFVPFWDITATATNKKILFSGFEAALNHDALTNYDANKHVDHTGVSISTGTGLSGGGTIASTRTLALDINGLAADTIVAGDSIPFYDTTGGACDKTTFASFEAALTHANLIGGHDLTTDIDHDTITNYVAAQHINWTGATDDFSTAGTGAFVPGAADAIAFNLDGTVNPFSTSGTTCSAMRFLREINRGTGNVGDIVGLYAYLTITHTNAKIVGTTTVRGHFPWISNTGTITNETVTNRSYIVYGQESNLSDGSTYNTTSTGRFYNYWYGSKIYAAMTPTFAATGGAGAAVYILAGQVIDLTVTPTLSSGSLTQSVRGLYLDVTGSAVGSGTVYGIYIAAVTGGDTNYAVWDISGANWALRTDSQELLFGTGYDASIKYDGTDMYVNPQRVGTGHLILGSFKTDTGDPAGVEGKLVINTFDNNIQLYADGAWQTLANW